MPTTDKLDMHVTPFNGVSQVYVLFPFLNLVSSYFLLCCSAAEEQRRALLLWRNFSPISTIPSFHSHGRGNFTAASNIEWANLIRVEK